MKRKNLVADIVLISVLLIVSLAFLLVNRTARKAGSFVSVAVRGQEIARYSLMQNGVYSVNGGTNTICIENMTVRMTDADCPDRLCVKQGVQKYSGQCITCLPNRLTVTVVNADNSVDFVM